MTSAPDPALPATRWVPRRWLRRPRRTVRLRLTLLYGGLSLLSGAGLLAITYALVSNRLPVIATSPRPLLTVTRAGNQGNDRWVVAHGASFPRPAGPRTCWLLPRSLVSRAAVPINAE